MCAIYVFGALALGLCAMQEEDKPPIEVLRGVIAEMRESQPLEPLPPPSDQTPAEISSSILSTLPTPPASPRDEGGSVSAASLRHKIPKDAEKSFKKAEQLSRAGKYAEASRELEKAVAVDPEFAQAHANLGAQYFRLGRYAEAGASLQRSLALDPAIAATHTNLALLQLTLGDLLAAEASARRALQLSSTNAGAHYSLGLALLPSPDARAEAMEHLEYAAKTIPAAKQVLEELRKQ